MDKNWPNPLAFFSSYSSEVFHSAYLYLNKPVIPSEGDGFILLFYFRWVQEQLAVNY